MAIEKIIGIVTDVVKHSDRHNVVSLFTRTHGRVSMLSAAGSGKSALARNAALVPLSVISADISFNPARELPFLGKFTRERLWKDLYFNPVKSSIGLFMAEFINAYTRQSPPDPQLWDFIVRAIDSLDKTRKGYANMHLAFLVEFMNYVGIRPDISGWRKDAWFDMRDGTMTLMPPSHRDILTPQRGAMLPLLLRMNMRNAHLFKMTGENRREMLQELLHYYSLHFPGLSSLKSPQVLYELFNS